jgi:DNA-methyltransferase (dcm)
MKNIGVIDLFSGCGGLCIGFEKAGFTILAGADIKESAVKTLNYNLHKGFQAELTHKVLDLTEAEPSDIYSGNKYKIVIGGPPCQAYSRAGRGKLRSLGEDRYHLNDPRGNLYKDFLRLCLGFDARAVVMENVPDATNYGGENIPDKACDILEDAGYTAAWSILNAADYGVPQIRERLFLIAVYGKYDRVSFFPKPSHGSVSGASTSWGSRKKIYEQSRYYIPLEHETCRELPWVTTGDALSDLPVLFRRSTEKYIMTPLNLMLQYAKSAPQNDFQTKMRTWRGIESEYITGNVFRKTKRDFPIFDIMKPGDTFDDVAKIADKMLIEAAKSAGISQEENPSRYEKLRKSIVPPYARDKFLEKWKRLLPQEPSHTLVAHLGVDTYSHIHPWEPRGISVREAARLQSFPDNFEFRSTMGDAFTQIGNAVPPLLSYQIASHLRLILE